MRFRETLELGCSAEQALEFIGDFRNLLQWDPSMLEARQTRGEGLSVGAEYAILLRFAGRRIAMHYVVREYQPGRRVVLEGDAAQSSARDTITAEPRGRGCRVRYDADIRVTGAGPLMDALLRLIFLPTVKRGMARLRRILGAAG